MKKLLLLPIVLGSLFILFHTETNGQELVLNGNLESWNNPNEPTNWTLFENISQESGTIHGGTYSARHTSDATTKKFQQELTGVVPGSLYTLSYWYYDNDPEARTRIWCYWLSGGATLPDNETELRPSTYSTDNPSWIQVTYALTAPASADGFRFEVRVYKENNISGGSVFYDDFSFATGGTPLPEPTYYPTDFVAQANNLAVDLIWTDSEGGQLPQSYLIKASETNNIIAPVDGVPEADDLDFTDGKGAKNILQGVQTFTFLNLKANQQYFFKIYPYTNGGTNINYKTDGTPPSASATTANITLILYKDFESLSFDPWDTISLGSSEKGWIISSFGGNNYAYINGYQASEDCNDWLISPSMNFDTYFNETLSFKTATNYTGPALEVKMSNDYVTGTDPTTATWIPITATLSPGTWTWTSSGNIDVSDITGNNVHLAYRYITALPDASAWEVDDIIITGTISSGIDSKDRSPVVQLSPNPATSKVVLSFSDSDRKEISILSLTGTRIFAESTTLTNMAIPLDNFSKGIYFVKISYPGTAQPVIKKLVIR